MISTYEMKFRYIKGVYCMLFWFKITVGFVCAQNLREYDCSDVLNNPASILLFLIVGLDSLTPSF